MTDDVAVTESGFEELAEDVSGSPLWNEDLAPTTLEQRTWSTWNIAALWIGMSVVITTYLLGGSFIQQGMNWWQAMLTILLGNSIVLIPMVLNAHAGTKYGISFPVLCRASFGTTGANIPAILRAIVACGWFGIQTWIGGTALDALFTAVWSGWASLGGEIAGVALHTWISFFIFWIVQVVIILRGIEGIKYLESWAAPLLLFGGMLLLVWASYAAGGLGNVLSGSSALQEQKADFWLIFPGALTASVGYWATLSLNIPDFTRYARSQRSQMLGQALGLPLTMTAFAFIGVAVTSATVIIYGEAIADPVALIQRFDSALIILFSMLVIFVAQLTTNMAANVVSPSNDFSNLNPKRISYVTGGIITAVIGILMMPWELMSSLGSYIFTWLIGYSGLMGAIGGILICDYWLIRKQKLDLAGLFDPKGEYSYKGGVNFAAVAALVLAIAPVVYGFIRAATTPGGQVADPGFFDTLYNYAWFVTFGIGFSVYWLLMGLKRS
ncbi:MAG: nitrate reductase [Acidobacteria bacterium]|nr:MAG: nitrate reductase [Acidobacteriota bacterium]REK02463.1 MAG: nitrate reductase [Acidobacteriota bacterium]REK13735.1 MAG: nitrate reductase [Acidobacteriota bacterium]REK41729.1 MAG: nitrate reductase [Acidobacteriota bacterium]